MPTPRWLLGRERDPATPELLRLHPRGSARTALAARNIRLLMGRRSGHKKGARRGHPAAWQGRGGPVPVRVGGLGSATALTGVTRS